MVTTPSDIQAEDLKSDQYDWKKEVKAFDESKAGVKGLVDAGVSKIPPMFIHKQIEPQNFPVSANTNIKIPLIDLDGIKKDASLRSKIIDEIRYACERWGIFQLINHGIPASILEEMLNGMRRFHEQDSEVKKEYYTRDYKTKNVLYNSNYNLFEAPAASWRDTLTFIRGVHRPPKPEELPATCRDIMIAYTDEIMKLRKTIYELLSESLRLNPNHLNDIGCGDGIFAPCHYYPPCPEPELTMGTTTHVDTGFITILLQDQIGGLQVLHENQWIDVTPIPGALVLNVGVLLQLISNDKFISPYHRVLAKKEGPRVSMACAFRTHHDPENSSTLYGPIKELVSEENPSIYRQVTVKEIIIHKHSKKTEENSFLPSPLHKFKLYP